jgi:hypothetical protein
MSSDDIPPPVAFMFFNRPEVTSRVFQKIREAKPRRLLLLADGPRPHVEGDAQRCAAARAAVECVDWPCEVSRQYSDTNLGCRRRVASGLDWVFGLANEAIILEDDCEPDVTFFRFCEELLQKYRNDERVMMITGTNQVPEVPIADSYIFSNYGSIWGWASWRRAWSHYDVAMTTWPLTKAQRLHYDTLDTPEECRAKETVWDRVCFGGLDTWDHQWSYCRLMNSGLSVVPRVNMISNLGFGSDSTHTRNPLDSRSAMPVRTMAFPLNHPTFVLRNRNYDRGFYARIAGTPRRNRFFQRVFNHLKQTSS